MLCDRAGGTCAADVEGSSGPGPACLGVASGDDDEEGTLLLLPLVLALPAVTFGAESVMVGCDVMWRKSCVGCCETAAVIVGLFAGVARGGRSITRVWVEI